MFWLMLTLMLDANFCFMREAFLSLRKANTKPDGNNKNRCENRRFCGS